MNLDLFTKSSLIIIISLICSIQDIKYRKISNIIFLIGFLLILTHYVIFNITILLQAIISSFLLTLLFFTGKKILNDRLGTGDILFSSIMGLSLPYLHSLLSIIISTIMCFIFTICYYLLKKRNLHITEIKVPFIPFLSLGFVITFFAFI